MRHVPVSTLQQLSCLAHVFPIENCPCFMEYSQTHSEDGQRPGRPANTLKQVVYRPLVLQCGTTGQTAQRRTFKTWFLCWPDVCNPHWTVIIWAVFSLAAYFVDVGLDVVEAVKYYRVGDDFWASAIVSFIALPYVISFVYFVIALRRPIFEVYPAGMVYWSWKTVKAYCALPCKRNISTPDDAKNYITKLRTFLRCNRERTRASDLDVYFGAIPQLIIQSYIMLQRAIATNVYDIPISSWLSLCSSAIFVLRYEPSARHGQKGMIVDLDTVIEPAVYDFVMENFFDFIFVIPRVIAIGCFLTVGYATAFVYVPAIGFFSVHLTAAFLWFWLSAPRPDNEHPDHRQAARDFRGTRRYRDDWFEHVQASIASLILPPTNKAWPTDFLSWKHRLRAVLTRQFCVVTVFQFVETVIMLGIWCATASYQFVVVVTAVPVVVWITGRMIFHVLYYAFVLFPFYTREWETCVRRRGLIAKMEIIRMAEEVGGYFCPKLGPRLRKVHKLIVQSGSTEQLKEELEWLSDRFLSESLGLGGGIKRGRTQRHRLMAMGPQEKDLMKAVRRLAARCREYLHAGQRIPGELTSEWLQLIRQNNDIGNFWMEVLLTAVTHHFLPSRLHQVDRDLSLSIYPKMFHNMVIRNNLHSKRIRDRNVTIYSKNRRRASAPSAFTLEMGVGDVVPRDDPISPAGSATNLTHSNPMYKTESFGEKLNFEYIESEPVSEFSQF
ncbi:uncharacterized protein LOC129589000 [Paramacrobiotus metropolitanus]|uniref:uncharacterized protein LOC129589000 n=1 Tax=Paramacrobiotus metropolitanus TaxID=2943436 RepID=UPI00244627C8|nr:uncharacterized protein LOC129589000 [Paramacrobiotus metropolitanus]